jgi:hypothetical protein
MATQKKRLVDQVRDGDRTVAVSLVHAGTSGCQEMSYRECTFEEAAELLAHNDQLNGEFGYQVPDWQWSDPASRRVIRLEGALHRRALEIRAARAEQTNA